MVDRLLSASTRVAMLRLQSARKNGQAVDTDAATDADAPAYAGDRQRRDIGVLRRQVADIVRDVDSGNPAAIAAVRSRVIRAVLQWEFGPELREHADWRMLLEAMTTALADEGPHRLDFARMIDDLRR
jgi:hypothetical protein